jgi:predicted transposase YbfD/YdcC
VFVFEELGMDATAAGGFLRYFSDLPDPRGRNRIHGLGDMIVMAVMAVVCGADGWAEVEQFAQAKREWLAKFLGLPGGVPAHDTFGRVFALLDPEALERCFLAWMGALVELAGGRLIAVDGKAIRRSFRHAWDKSGMAHLVSAFVSQGDNRLVFGQLAVEGKGNEITAIPRLLELMDLKGAVVTVDAIGCQREVARKVVGGGGDYVLAVKQNQKTLHRKVKALMHEAALAASPGVEGIPHGYYEHSEQGHGRLETRRVWVVGAAGLARLGKGLLGLWEGLKGGCVVMVERVRQDLGDFSDPENGAKVTVERHYYISSVGFDARDPRAAGAAAEAMAGYVRGHWAVENNLHWQLDVSFREDERRIRKGHGAQNFSRLCRIALNLLKRDKTVKLGIKGKRLNAGWDHDYLLRLIGA